MTNTTKNDRKVQLTITLPQRESDWLIAQLDALSTPFEKQWVGTLEEFGPNCDLQSAYEKVTGRAKCGRFVLLGSAELANTFLDNLRASNHPGGIYWTYTELPQSGML